MYRWYMCVSWAARPTHTTTNDHPKQNIRLPHVYIDEFIHTSPPLNQPHATTNKHTQTHQHRLPDLPCAKLVDAAEPQKYQVTLTLDPAVCPVPLIKGAWIFCV